jgi:hypothetical protein
LQSSCNSDDLKEKENGGGRRRQRNRCSKKLEIAQAAKTRTSPRKKTRGTQKTQERRVKVLGRPLEFWNVKPTESGIVFFLSVFGVEWIRVFTLSANRVVMLLKIGDALVT